MTATGTEVHLWTEAPLVAHLGRSHPRAAAAEEVT